MNFWQRLQNFISNNFDDVLREFVYLPVQRKLFNKYFKTDIHLDDLLYNISLILTTSHPSINDAIPHTPNTVEIGGYHIFLPKTLPQDLQNYLDNASEGVILFSIGSNLKSKDLTLKVRKAILNSFSKINQKVLWKFETDLPEAPKNVKIMNWLPQQDIIGHPNIRAFITHGGLLSTTEAVYYGVPIIGIPVFGDQKSNIAAAVSNGYAIEVPLAKLTEEMLSEALNEILNIPKYKENVQKRSKLMHDQPLKPIDLAIYWIEYVIRHKGAPHLRSAGLDLKWYQREMIDVIAFLIACVAAILTVVYITIKKVICKRKSVKKTNKLKKNKLTF
ncbi:UDP-glycosyltransferase UGT5-like isoform X2 [Tribolium madens]|nr:UDP-glycosyltransferase UGT5-like isoform X2 [Tribolium madens]XP_044271527.1 UDP-glycosyltransferase UGT5-like isoform X2 [Tribolium madens]